MRIGDVQRDDGAAGGPGYRVHVSAADRRPGAWPAPIVGAVPPTAPAADRPTPALALAGLLGAAGLTHLLRPRIYDRLIPRWLGRPRPWVVVSGLAELACAVAVAAPRTRRAGALATVGLFVAVLPGNVQMALDARPGARSWARRPVVAWGRLPLQVPLVVWAWRVAHPGTDRRPSGRGAARAGALAPR
jgi:uncharacterized membrane protein